MIRGVGTDDVSATRGTLDAIRRVIEAFERSDWAEIDVRMGDVRVHLSAADIDVVRAADAVTRDDHRPTGSGEIEPERVVDAGHAIDPRAHVVTAKSPGIFWCSPEPGAPPFVELEDEVDVSTTVCIIEVMKLMNHVKAGTAGRVVAVYGVNGAAVEKGSPLFAIDSGETRE
jgi:acetyl-CoA carboxylase biotin carboxyl carrier protein